MSLKFGLLRGVQPFKPLYNKAERAQDLMQLKQFNEAAQVESILAKYPTANAWLPLKANAEDMVVLVNKDTAEVVKIVDLRPWN